MAVKLPIPRSALTTLEIVLESDGDLSSSRLPSNGTSRRSVSVLRCVVLTQHLERVIGAIGRAISSKSLGPLELSVLQREVEVNGRPAVVLGIEASARVKRLRTRVLRTILPATIAVDSSPSVSDFLAPCIGPIVLADVGGDYTSRSAILIRKVSAYTMEGPSGHEKILLRQWTAPAPRHRAGH